MMGENIFHLAAKLKKPSLKSLYQLMLINGVHKLTEMLKSRQHLADAATTFVVRVAAAVLAYGVQVFLARMMNLEEYGTYAALWTWLIIANHLAVFGFSESALRFLPRYMARNQHQWAIGFLKTGFITTLIASAATGIVGLILIANLGTLLPSVYFWPIVILCVGLPVMAMELYLEGVSRSLGWYLLTIVPAYVVRPLLIGAGVFALVLNGYEVDASAVLAIAVVITTGIIITQILIMRGRIKKQMGEIPAAKTQKLWVKSSLPLVFSTSVDELYIWSDILILSIMVTGPEIAVYFAAQRSMSLASFVQYAFMLVTSRQFSLANALHDREGLQKQITSASRWTFWLTVPAVGLTLLAGYPLLWLFGEAFLSGLSIMGILGMGFLFRASVGQAQDLLIVLGHQKANLYISSLGLLFNVVLSIFLVPSLGIMGAALATTITFALRSAILVWATWRLCGLWVLTDIPDAMPAMNMATKTAQSQMK